MMKNKEKLSIGLFLDGQNLKIAQVRLIDKYKFEIMKLREFKLPDHVMIGSGETSINNNLNLTNPDNNSISFNEPKDSELNLDSMEDYMGINDEDTFSDIEPIKNDLRDAQAFKEELQIPQEGSMLAQGEIAKFLSDFDFLHAKVSFTASEDKIFWTYLPFSNKKKSKSQYRKQLLSKEQTKDPSVQFDLLTNNDNSGYALIYQGQHEVINILESSKAILNIKYYNYHHADPIEISLINALYSQYKFPEKQYILLLYLSKEIKIAVITYDNNFVKSFPLIIQGSDYDIIREAIVSKIMLEQDISQINITQNVLLAGDFTSEVDLDFFALHFKSDYIDVFSFDNPFTPAKGVDITINEFVKEKNISSYLIPISVAVKSLVQKNKFFIPTNLLPRDILEKQKIFKLAWHGYLILVLIFITTLWVTSVVLSSNSKIKRLRLENQKIEFEINQKKAFQNLLQSFNIQLANFEDNRKKVIDVLKTQNQWHYIIQKVTSFSQNNPSIWLNSIKAQPDNFVVSAYTLTRSPITAFSNLFPQGSISRINLTKIETENVWEFDIVFNYPDPNFYDPLFSEIKVDTLAIYAALEQQEKKIEKVIIKEQIIHDKIPLTSKDIKTNSKSEIDKLNENNSLNEKIKNVPVLKSNVKKSETKLIPKQEIKKKTELSSETKVIPKKKKTQKEDSTVINDSKQQEESIYTKARKCYLAGEYQQSIDLFKQFVENNPDHYLIPLSWYLTGEAYFGLKDYNKAIQNFEKAVNHSVKKPESLLMIGNCYRILKKDNDAIAAWERLIEECGNSSQKRIAELKLKKIKAKSE